MRNTRCYFCSMIFNDKQKYCNHIAMKHNDQIPDECDPLEFAYSLLVNKPIGRLCTECHKHYVHFNTESLKYERICDDPACKESYTRMMKERMMKVYGKEHMLNDADMQRKMIYNHANAHDYSWNEKYKLKTADRLFVKEKEAKPTSDFVLYKHPRKIKGKIVYLRKKIKHLFLNYFRIFTNSSCKNLRIFKMGCYYF